MLPYIFPQLCVAKIREIAIAAKVFSGENCENLDQDSMNIENMNFFAT